MTESFAVATETYQGPLEALLDLIEARKLSITDISLAAVADSFLGYVEKLPSLPLKETSQFVLVASTLLLIKSRSLLPLLELSEDERESVHELEKRLTRLKLVRDASRLLRKRWGTASLIAMKFGGNVPIQQFQIKQRAALRERRGVVTHLRNERGWQAGFDADVGTK